MGDIGWDAVITALIMAGLIWYDIYKSSPYGNWSHICRVILICTMCCFSIINSIPNDMQKIVSIALACFMPFILIYWLIDRYKHRHMRNYIDE